MARLALYLLGQFNVTLDEEPVTGFRSDKERALLIYLAVEADRPHRREKLADLLWPELSEQKARNNLRVTLHRLRGTLGEHDEEVHFLNISRGAVQLNPEAEILLDIASFTETMAEVEGHEHSSLAHCWTCMAQLGEVIEYYRGDFLQGFIPEDSLVFLEWAGVRREWLHVKALEALHHLAEHHRRRGEFELAQNYARRQLELEPWREEAHRQIMELLARLGERSAALAQYETCRRVLAEELGLEPSEETTALYERIQAGELDALPQRPEFLEEQVEDVAEKPLFVARESELSQLHSYLEAALEGGCPVVFLTGDAGQGKTSLLAEFSRQALASYPDLLVASGNCNAHAGIGDPYLPFRDIMNMLTGDVEARWKAGTISREGAQRLWLAIPAVIQALLTHGRSLIDILVPGQALVSRASVAVPGNTSWLRGLREAILQVDSSREVLEGEQIFEQLTNVLSSLSESQPLLLTLDDMQWADQASISLFFHLGRRLAGSRVLLICAYRPEELALGRGGDRHPLEKVINELNRQYGDIQVALGRTGEAERWEFVNAYLDSEPNHLGKEFRQTLFEHTGGHPLFTVELLRAMQERGDLLQEDGAWVQGSSLDWNSLPSRVEAVIEERIGRLEEQLRQTLNVACVEGEDFTAQVVARVQEASERGLVRQLSQELDRRHRLVGERGVQQLGDHKLYRYRFRHHLFQQHLYRELGAIERQMLHEGVGSVLEALYEGREHEIGAQLAWHFTEAANEQKAVPYLLMAGDHSRNMYAHQEAIASYEKAIDLLEAAGEDEKAARTLMKLGLTYHNAFEFEASRRAYDRGFIALQRAGELSDQPPPAPHPLRRIYDVPSTLDPSRCVDAYSFHIIYQLFSGLVELSPNLSVLPDVARSWEVLEGGRMYVFHLRNDVYWSDGVQVTAGDFEYAWRRVLDPSADEWSAGLLSIIKGAKKFYNGELSDPNQIGVQARDELTLVVELVEPTSYFLQLLTHVNAFPIPRHLVEVEGEAWTDKSSIVTNGPFKLATWDRDGAVFERNPAYHGRFSGNLEQVEISFFSEEKLDLLNKYENEDVDFLPLWPLSPAEADAARQQYAGEYITGPMLFLSFIGFESSRAPLDDPRVRQALTLATSREMLVSVIGRALQFPATGGLIPPGMPGHSPDIALPYDPERARRLLAEAGYPGGRGFPELDGIGIAEVGPSYLILIDALREQWSENLGIDVNWNFMGLDKFLERFGSHTPDLWFAGIHPEYPDPDSILRAVWIMPMEKSNWRNVAYEKLLNEARHLMDQGKRIDLYQQADRILVEEAPILPLEYIRFNILVKPWVKNLVYSTVRFAFWKDVIIEPH